MDSSKYNSVVVHVLYRSLLLQYCNFYTYRFIYIRILRFQNISVGQCSTETDMLGLYAFVL
jgi:hypothetical protein